MHANGPQHVGAPDPELRTSPIVAETADDFEIMAREIAEDGLCYFNARPFAQGAFVCSGTELLQCERGAWIIKGGCDPDNP